MTQGILTASTSLPAAAMFALGDGDSGSGIMESSRANAPVIAVVSASEIGAHLWNSSNAAFLWGVIGVDALGFPICSGTGLLGCTLRGNTVPERDVDRDGLPDSRDRCPNVPRTADCNTNFGGTPNQHCDADNDFVGNGCDSFAGVCNWDDDDRDGTPDPNDACPDNNRVGAFGSSGGVPTAPPGMSDRDSDAVPDICDLCPDTANAQGMAQRDNRIDMINDLDVDGVPTACDNCAVPNPSQANCNFDAERQLGLINLSASQPGVGDACDSFQCGETLYGTRTSGATTRTDEIRVDALRVTTPPLSSYSAWTGTRYCRCLVADADTPATRVACLAVSGTTGGCSISNVARYDAMVEPKEWRRMTLTWTPRFVENDTRFAAPVTEARAYYAVPEPAFVVDRRSTWATETDITRWTTLFDEMIPFGAGYPLRGVAWTHTPGDLAAAFTTTTRERTNHYLSSPVAAPRTRRTPWPCLEFIGSFGLGPSRCADCAASFPSWLGAPVSGTCSVGGLTPSGTPVIQFAEDYVDLAEIFTSPPTWLTNPQDPEWAVSRWVAAPDHAAPDATSLRYVRLNRNTGVVLRTLNESAGGLVAGCTSSCTNQGTLPSVSTGYFAAASAKHASVWVLSATGSLSRYNITTAQWQSLPLPIAFGTIEAMAYDPKLEELLVLDRFTDAAGSRVRLFRAPIHGGSIELLVEWARQASTIDFGLASDGRGVIYVTASTSSNYCVLAFESKTPGNGVAPTAWRARQGTGRIQTEHVSADVRGFSAPILSGGAITLAGFDDDGFVPLTSQILAQCL